MTVHFSRGIPPLEAIPSAAIAEHTSAVLAAEPDRVFQYAPIGHHTGDQELREQLGKFHSVDPDRVFVTNGSLQALDLLASHLLRGAARPQVLVEAPTYDRAVQIFERHGARVSGVPLRHDGIDVDILKERLRTEVPAFVYVIPDFQNPSGVTTSEDKRRELVRLSAEYGFTILEDIPYRELRFGGTAPTPFGELAESADGARVLTIGSLSKVLSPGLRVGYVIGPPGTPAPSRPWPRAPICPRPRCSRRSPRGRSRTASYRRTSSAYGSCCDPGTTRRSRRCVRRSAKSSCACPRAATTSACTSRSVPTRSPSWRRRGTAASP